MGARAGTHVGGGRHQRDGAFDRNYLRLRVLPLIRDRWPGLATAVARSARHAAEAQSLLDTLARADTERASYGESLSIKSLRALPSDRRRNALRFWITRAGYLAPDTKRARKRWLAHCWTRVPTRIRSWNGARVREVGVRGATEICCRWGRGCRTPLRTQPLSASFFGRGATPSSASYPTISESSSSSRIPRTLWISTFFRTL